MQCLDPEFQPGMAVTFAGDTATLAAARQRVGDWMANEGCGSDDIEVAQLIVSELASNAIEASAPKPYRVSIHWRGGRLVLAVTNAADRDDIPDSEDWGPASVLASRGRGLAIVQALAADVSVSLDGLQLSVVASLPVTRPGAP